MVGFGVVGTPPAVLPLLLLRVVIGVAVDVAGPVCPCDPTDGGTAGAADLPVASVALEADSGVVVVGLPLPARVCLPEAGCWSVPLACL